MSMRALNLEGTPATVQREILLAAAIADIERGGASARGISYAIGKEVLDQARDALATDAVWSDLLDGRGRAQDRVVTHDVYTWVAGDAWMRAKRDAPAAGFAPPSVGDQRMAPYGLTYRIEGYRRGRTGGNRHILSIADETVEHIKRDTRTSQLIEHVKAVLNDATRGRLAHGVPYRQRSNAQRSISRRSRLRATARRLLARPAGEVAAMRRALAAVLDAVFEKGRALSPRDRVAIAADEVRSEEEHSGWRELLRKRQARRVRNALGDTTFLLNLRVFAAYVRPEAEDVRRALLPRNSFDATLFFRA